MPAGACNCSHIVSDILGKDAIISKANVTQQLGGADCGLFAIAFALSLAGGRDPTKMVFDQRKLRSHLVTCLTTEKFTDFPELQSTGGKFKVY